MKSMLICVLLLATGRAVQGQVGTGDPDALAGSTQMIVVTTSDWNAVEGRLQRFERPTPLDVWSPLGEPTLIVVGKNGLGWGTGVVATDDPNIRSASDPVKKEGDSKAPAGIFPLGTAFGYTAQPLPGSKMPYLNLTASIECVDDPASKYYNRVVDCHRQLKNPQFWAFENSPEWGGLRLGIGRGGCGGGRSPEPHPPDWPIP